MQHFGPPQLGKPSALDQLRAAWLQFIRDPFGTVVGTVKQQVADLRMALFSITPEELANPIIRSRITALGVDPDKLGPTATAQDVARAQGRSMAIVAGFGAGGLLGTMLGPAASLAGAAWHGAAEALAFGVVGGTLTPVEEEQTRAGNVLTWSAFAVPFGTAGGVTSFAIAKQLRAHGIKPELDAPEVAHTPSNFDAKAVAAADAPTNLPRAPRRLGPSGRSTPRGMARGLVRQPPRSALLPPTEITREPPRPSLPPPLGRRKGALAERGVGGRELTPAGPSLPPPIKPPSGAGVTEEPSAPKLLPGTTVSPVDEVLRHVSIGQQAKGVPFTRHTLYTHLVDDLHPINVATKDLLKLQQQLGPVETSPWRKVMAEPDIALETPTFQRRGLPLPSERAIVTAEGDVIIPPPELPRMQPPRRLLPQTERPTAERPTPPTTLTPGQRLPGIEDPYVLARLTRGSTAKATQFLESGPLHFKTLQPVGPSLREILAPIIERGDVGIRELRAFLVAPRTLELANRGIKTPIPIDMARAVIEQASPDVVQAGLRIFEYNNRLLDYVKDSGMLSDGAVEAMRALNKHYIPFFRFIDVPEQTLQAPGVPPTTRRFVNVTTGIKPIKGGETLAVIDPLESVVKNTYALVSIADRHAVAEALVSLADHTPGQTIIRSLGQQPAQAQALSKSVAIELQARLKEVGVALPETAAEEVASAMRIAKTLPEGMFWVLRGGRKQFYEVDAPLWRSLIGVDREQAGTLLRILAAPAQLQRVGFTAFSPSFVFRNPFRDQFSAAVFSRYGFKPGVDLTRGLFHAYGNDELYLAFRRSGGEHATIVRTLSRDRLAQQRVVNDLLKRESMLTDAFKTAATPKGWFNGIRRLSELNEEATRSQEFVRALAQTKDPRLSGFANREVTLDFARVGQSMRIANQLIPFFNATIQDVDKIVRTFGAEGGARAFHASTHAITWITLPSVALYLVNRDDENFHELTNVRRNLFWNIPRWRFNDEQGRYERTGKFLSIPKPFLIGLMFGSVPERVLEWMDQNDPQMLDALAKNLFEGATPSLLPGGVSPVLENWTNYDFFRNRPLIPESEQRLIAEEQAGPLQGETVRALGKVLNVSPREVENIINGYTGGIGRVSLTLADAALRAVGVKRPQEPTREPSLIPFVSELLNTFLIDEPTVSSKSVERFYSKWTEVEAQWATFMMMRKTPGRVNDAMLLAEDNADIRAYPLFVQTSGAIAKLRGAIATARANANLTPEERQERVLAAGRSIRTLAGNAMRGYAQLQKSLRPVTFPLRVGETLLPVER